MTPKDNMSFIHQHIDFVKAGLVALGFYGISLARIDLGLKIAVGVLTVGYMGVKLGYTIWKWRKEAKKE